MPALHEILPVAPEVVERYEVLSPESSLEVVEAIATTGTFKVLKAFKALNVMELPDGGQFVARDYSQCGVDAVERKTGVEFAESWGIMHEMYGRAEIDIVPSFVLDHGEGSKDKRLTVVSAYLPTATPLNEAATQPKRDLAFKLGKLTYDSRRYAPAQEALMPDMFHATDTTEAADVLLTDVDPFVVNHMMFSRSGPAEQFGDKARSDYIMRVADLIWDKWCEGNEDERESVTRSFVRGVGEGLPEDIGLNATFLAFNELVMRGNGLRGGVETRQEYIQA